MRIFKEKQRFRQWWLIVIMAVVVCSLFLNFYHKTEGFTVIESKISLFFTSILTLIVVGGIFLLELRTKIDPVGITANFHPLPLFQKHFTWSQIEKVYVRKYSALTEYGGWGIRGFGESKAYNISGSYGIQIVTKQNKRFLIGTQKQEEAEKVLARYQDKIKA